MAELKTRMLNLSFPTLSDKYIQSGDGSLLVKGVKVLEVGEWTDSAIGTPLVYPATILERDATNWLANGYWARHAGGAPRNLITDKLGEVVNPRFEMTEAGGAVFADVFYHGLTQVSKDGIALAIGMAKAGKPLAVSVEWYGEDKYNNATKKFEASRMSYIGLAAVDKGACSTCGLPKAMEDNEGTNMNEEIKTMLDAFKAELIGEVDKKLAGFAPAKDPVAVADLEALKTSNAELKTANKALEERIVKLEKTPEPRTKAREIAELAAEPPTGDVIRYKGGKIYREG